MTSTWELLQVARDARLMGDTRAALLYAEAAPDFEYKRCTHVRKIYPFELDEGDQYDDYDPEPEAVQRAQWRADVLATDWLAWRGNWKPRNLSSFDAIIRDAYPAESVHRLAGRMLHEGREQDPDAFEMRIRSWANIITGMPRAVLRLDPP